MDSIIASNRRPAPRLARPAERYWKGKLPKGIDAAEAGSDSEEEREEEVDLVEDVPLGAVGSDEDVAGPCAPKVTTKAMNLSLKDVKISAEGRVTVAGRQESGKTEIEEGEVLLPDALGVLISFTSRGSRRGRGSEEGKAVTFRGEEWLSISSSLAASMKLKKILKKKRKKRKKLQSPNFARFSFPSEKLLYIDA
jgi:hypothetical protein